MENQVAEPTKAQISPLYKDFTIVVSGVRNVSDKFAIVVGRDENSGDTLSFGTHPKLMEDVGVNDIVQATLETRVAHTTGYYDKSGQWLWHTKDGIGAKSITPVQRVYTMSDAIKNGAEALKAQINAAFAK